MARDVVQSENPQSRLGAFKFWGFQSSVYPSTHVGGCNPPEKERDRWVAEVHWPACPKCQVLSTMRALVLRQQGGWLLKVNL